MATNPTASDMAKIRWAKTTPVERKNFAKMMAKARWHKKLAAPILEKTTVNKIRN